MLRTSKTIKLKSNQVGIISSRPANEATNKNFVKILGGDGETLLKILLQAPGRQCEWARGMPLKIPKELS